MAQSTATKVIRAFTRLLMLAFVLGFLPYLVFKAACTEPKKRQTLDEAYGKKDAPVLGEPAAPPASDTSASPDAGKSR